MVSTKGEKNTVKIKWSSLSLEAAFKCLPLCKLIHLFLAFKTRNKGDSDKGSRLLLILPASNYYPPPAFLSQSSHTVASQSPHRLLCAVDIIPVKCS